MNYRDWLVMLDNHVSDAGAGVISIICLSITLVNCLAVVFALEKRPSLARAIGHLFLGLWTLSRLPVKFTTLHTTPEHLVLHIGLAILSISSLNGIWKDLSPLDLFHSIRSHRE